MRFRTDGWHYADLKAANETFESHYVRSSFKDDEEYERWRANWNKVPKAEPGDTWRVFWRHDVDGNQVDDQLAGYAICCIGCGRVHMWTTALNCHTKHPAPWGETCNHIENHTTCWEWTGSAEEGTLSAAPSLQVVKDRCPWGCGWHGFIHNGDIHV